MHLCVCAWGRVGRQKGWQSRYICVCVCCGGAVSANGQETLNARGYKPTHTLSVFLSHTHIHTNVYVSLTHTPMLCLGKLRQAACSVTTWVSGWSEKERKTEKKQKVVRKGRRWWKEGKASRLDEQDDFKDFKSIGKCVSVIWIHMLKPQFKIKFSVKLFTIWCRCQKTLLDKLLFFRSIICTSIYDKPPAKSSNHKPTLSHSNIQTMHGTSKYCMCVAPLEATQIRRQNVTIEQGILSVCIYTYSMSKNRLSDLQWQCKHLKPATALLVLGSILPLCHTVIHLIFKVKSNIEFGRCWQPV